MATAAEVLGMLIPNGGYVARGENYEGIEFLNCEPITKEQFENGFMQYDQWKSEKNLSELAAKSAAESKLVALGLTSDDLKAALGV